MTLATLKEWMKAVGILIERDHVVRSTGLHTEIMGEGFELVAQMEKEMDGLQEQVRRMSVPVSVAPWECD